MLCAFRRLAEGSDAKLPFFQFINPRQRVTPSTMTVVTVETKRPVLLIGAFAVGGMDSNPDPGIHHKLATAIIGGTIMLIGIFLWALEGADGYHLHLDKDGKPVDDAHATHH